MTTGVGRGWRRQGARKRPAEPASGGTDFLVTVAGRRLKIGETIVLYAVVPPDMIARSEQIFPVAYGTRKAGSRFDACFRLSHCGRLAPLGGGAPVGSQSRLGRDQISW
jgi:hypothetical protein